MPKQYVHFRDLALRLSEASGLSPQDAADLYSPAIKARRPACAVWRLGDTGNQIIVKMFAPYVTGGPQVGFLKSSGIPQLICSTEDDDRTDRTDRGSARIVRILTDVIDDARTSVQYYTMEYLPKTVDWSRPNVFRGVLDLLTRIQSSMDLRTVMEGNQEHPSRLSPTAARVLTELTRPHSHGHAGQYAYNFVDSISGLYRELEKDRELGRKDVVELINRCVSNYMDALEWGEQPPLVLAHRDTGLGNFRCSHEGAVCLFDFEHARLDNPLSDYVHLWMRLREWPGRERASEEVIDHLHARFGDEKWFGPVLRMCVAEKVLGHLNHLIEYREDGDGFDLPSLLSVAHDHLDQADGIARSR